IATISGTVIAVAWTCCIATGRTGARCASEAACPFAFEHPGDRNADAWIHFHGAIFRALLHAVKGHVVATRHVRPHVLPSLATIWYALVADPRHASATIRLLYALAVDPNFIGVTPFRDADPTLLFVVGTVGDVASVDWTALAIPRLVTRFTDALT